MTTPPPNDWLEEVLKSYTRCQAIHEHSCTRPKIAEAKLTIHRHILDLRIQDAENVVQMRHRHDQAIDVTGTCALCKDAEAWIADLRTQREGLD